MIKINLNVLMAALIIAPKEDVRYYLNGINISVNRVTSTDGHRLFTYDITETFEEGNDNEFCEEFESFIIPRDSIVQINKSLTVSERKSAVISITKNDSHYQLTCENSIVCFHPIDGKYPDYKRVVPGKYETKPHSTYNWTYMNDFSKISKLLGDKFGTASLIPNGDNSALVTLPDSNATCVIMPMRE